MLPATAEADCRARAEQLVEEHWDAVERMTEALLALDEIGYEEIEMLVEGKTLRDIVIIRVEWGGRFGPVPPELLKRFNILAPA